MVGRANEVALPSWLTWPRRLYGGTGKRTWRRALVLFVVLSFVLTPHVLSWFTDPLRLLPWLFVLWLVVFKEAGIAGRGLWDADSALRRRAGALVYRIVAIALGGWLALAGLVALGGDTRLFAPLGLLGVQALVLGFRLPALVSLWIAPDGQPEERSVGAVVIERV